MQYLSWLLRRFDDSIAKNQHLNSCPLFWVCHFWKTTPVFLILKPMMQLNLLNQSRHRLWPTTDILLAHWMNQNGNFGTMLPKCCRFLLQRTWNPWLLPYCTVVLHFTCNTKYTVRLECMASLSFVLSNTQCCYYCWLTIYNLKAFGRGRFWISSNRLRERCCRITRRLSSIRGSGWAEILIWIIFYLLLPSCLQN